MLFQTTAAHEELRAKIRSFAEEEIKPLAFLMDQIRTMSFPRRLSRSWASWAGWASLTQRSTAAPVWTP